METVIILAKERVAAGYEKQLKRYMVIRDMCSLGFHVISSENSLFSDRVGLPPHNTPFPGV